MKLQQTTALKKKILIIFMLQEKYEATIGSLRNRLFRNKRGEVRVPGETCMKRCFMCVLLSEYYCCDEMSGICGTRAERRNTYRVWWRANKARDYLEDMADMKY